MTVELWWHTTDMVSKAVALTLILMSLLSWTVIMVKAWRVFQLKKMAKAVDSHFWHASSFNQGLQLLEPHTQDNPFYELACNGQDALQHHHDNRQDLHGALSLHDWVMSNLKRGIEDSLQRMQSGLTVLASIGSTAPFVGLLGTVWGIYHALMSISASGAASIDKVAGPVGEALIMTAFGLAVAIPAVLAYNTLARANKQILGQLQRFAHDLHAYFVTGSPIAKREQVSLVTAGE